MLLPILLGGIKNDRPHDRRTDSRQGDGAGKGTAYYAACADLGSPAGSMVLRQVQPLYVAKVA
jgi:hypothetical protein